MFYFGENSNGLELSHVAPLANYITVEALKWKGGICMGFRSFND